jgi:hypothetical protein
LRDPQLCFSEDLRRAIQFLSNDLKDPDDRDRRLIQLSDTEALHIQGKHSVMVGLEKQV